MGVDAIIMFRSLDGKEPDDAFLPEGYKYEVPDDCWLLPHDVYQVDCDCERYYGVGYERGSWLRISNVLMGLLASPNVADVSYDADCSFVSERRTIITPAEVLALHAHYMEHGHRPYLSWFPSRQVTKTDLPKKENSK